MADPTVNIIITAVDKTQAAIGSVTGGLGKVAGLAAKGLAVGLGAAAAGLAAVGGAAAKLAIDAMPVKGIQDAFYGLADAAGVGGDKMLAALQKGSGGMITNRNLMQSFNKAAQLVSKDFAVQLPDAMQYLSKVAAATGQDMGFMMDSLVTGVGRMSPMILDNLGIQVSLTEATDRAAQMFGKQAEELTKSEQQAGLMNVVMEKLAENTASMPDVVGSAQQQWASLGVQFQNIKDELGIALLPAFQAVLGWLNDNLMPFITGTLVPWLKDNIPIAIQKLSEFWTNTLQPAIQKVWAWMSGTLIPFLQSTVYPWLKDNIPAAIQTLSNFWTNTLKPAIETVWNWMNTVLMPFLRDVVYPWLKDNLTAAIQTLSNFWTNTLKPAILAVWNWMNTVLIPFLRDVVYPWLAENIPAAIQTLSDFWTGTLKPAIEAVWGFINDYIIPIFTDLWDLLSVAGEVAILAISKLWTETLKPAIDDVWGFINDNLIPIFEDVWDWFNNKLGPPIQTLVDGALKSLKDAFVAVRDAIQWVIDKFVALKEKLKGGVDVPNGIKQNSPSEFETAFMDAAKAVDILAMKALPNLKTALAFDYSVPGGISSANARQISYNYYLTANYDYQSPRSLAQDIRLLEMLHT